MYLWRLRERQLISNPVIKVFLAGAKPRSAFAYKLPYVRTLLRSQPCRQHRVKAPQTQSIRIIARVFPDLHSTRDTNHLETRVSLGCSFNHFFIPPYNFTVTVEL